MNAKHWEGRRRGKREDKRVLRQYGVTTYVW